MKPTNQPNSKQPNTKKSGLKLVRTQPIDSAKRTSHTNEPNISQKNANHSNTNQSSTIQSRNNPQDFRNLNPNASSIHNALNNQKHHSSINDDDSTETDPSQLDSFVEQLQPILRHITLHRFLLGFTCVCAFIAWNRGLMLLYALVAFLVAVLLVSYIYRLFNLSNIDIDRNFPKLVIAGQSFSANYEVYVGRHKHFLKIIDYFERQNLMSAHEIEPAHVLQPLFFTHIHHYSQVEIKQQLPMRGVYFSNSVLLSCAYPLGLLPNEKSQKIAPHKIFVLPPKFNIQQLDFSQSQNSNVGNIISQQTGMANEVTGLRQYRRGDEFKHIHWRATAKQISQNQEWISKQFDSESKPSLLVLINQFQCRDTSFETMLTIVRSVAHYASAKSLPCIILGVETHQNNSENANTNASIVPWHITVPALEEHLDDNLIKLAKLNWLANYSPTSKISGTTAINNYTDLMAYGLSENTFANTIITFSPFETDSPVDNATHLNFRFIGGSHNPTNPLHKYQTGNQFIYEIPNNCSLTALENLFKTDEFADNTNMNPMQPFQAQMGEAV